LQGEASSPHVVSSSGGLLCCGPLPLPVALLRIVRLALAEAPKERGMESCMEPVDVLAFLFGGPWLAPLPSGSAWASAPFAADSFAARSASHLRVNLGVLELQPTHGQGSIVHPIVEQAHCVQTDCAIRMHLLLRFLQAFPDLHLPGFLRFVPVRNAGERPGIALLRGHCPREHGKGYLGSSL
jgi:hypothetical protein